MSLTRKLLLGQSSFMLRKPCCGICIFVTYYFDIERLKLWYHCENIISEAANRDKHTLHIEFSWILMTQIRTVLSFYVSLSDWNATPCPAFISGFISLRFATFQETKFPIQSFNAIPLETRHLSFIRGRTSLPIFILILIKWGAFDSLHSAHIVNMIYHVWMW